MKKAYKITNVQFENECLILWIDGKMVKLKLADVSIKLSEANDIQRRDFKITPSGYGINWTSIDEDLSINGLLNVEKEQKQHIGRQK